LIALKALLLATMYALVLRAQPMRSSSTLFLMGWTLAVLAGSFRFIERASILSDLFCIVLLSWLLETKMITRGLVLRLTVLFGLWVQLHPGYPLGLVLLGGWALAHRPRNSCWLMLPPFALVLNPEGLTGALYPFRFALDEARVFRQFNFEWLPSYDARFISQPETMAFWALSLVTLYLLTRDRLWFTWRGLTALMCLLLGAQTIRFVPWTSCASLLLLKSSWEFHLGRHLWERRVAGLFLIVLVGVGIKNLVWGYHSSSGQRQPGFALDLQYAPSKTLEVLRSHRLPGHLYNTHDLGGSLIWDGQAPVFHHGFVTDMKFYREDVVGVFQGTDRFTELARRYGWTMLLVDKVVSYRYFHQILSPRPQWKIVAEDEASYLIYLDPGALP